jgi:hypothetical protein
MSAADPKQPLARGDLAQTPFAHLVLYVRRQGLNGTLILDRGGFDTKVLFREGRAVAARPLTRGAALHDGLLELCALASAPYAFWEGDLVGDDPAVVKGTLDALLFVADSVRVHEREVVIASIVDRYREIPLHAAEGSDAKRLGLRGEAARLLDILRAEALTPDALATKTRLPLPEVRRVLYLLLVTRMAEPLDAALRGGSGTSGVREAVSIPPGSVPPVSPSSARPSGVPSVPAGAAPSSNPVRTSSPSANPRSTPAAGQGASSVRPRTTSPARGTSIPAWQQLAGMRGARGDSGPIAKSPSAPAPSVPTPSKAPPPLEYLDDAGKLRRAEQLAERQHYPEALRIVDGLLASDSRNAKYHAARAWMLYLQFIGDRPPRNLLDAIDQALRLDILEPRALYVKGLVAKRVGKDGEASRCFHQILDLNPDHVDAQRELRLLQLRKKR